MPKKTVKLFEPKYTRHISEFICNKVEEGLTVKEICTKYADIVPIEKTIYRWKKKYPEFHNALNASYNTFFMRLIDEVRYLMNQEVPTHLAPNEKSLWLKERDQKLKTNQFLLTKIAPKFVPELQEYQKGPAIVNIPAINVINYSDAQID